MGWIFKLKWLAKRTIVLAAGLILLAQVCVDFDKTRLKVLNDAQPSLDYLTAFMLNPRPGDAALLKPYARYFRLTVQYLPLGPAPHAMLGYCQYYLGNNEVHSCVEISG